MKKFFVVSMVFVLLSGVVGLAPAYAMRCGTDLITEDSSKFEVLQACGEPLKKFGEEVEIGEEGISAGGYEKWVYDIGGGVYHNVFFHGNEVWKIEIERK